MSGRAKLGILLLLLCLGLVVSCDQKDHEFVATGSAGGAATAPTGTLRLSLGFSELQSGQLAEVGVPVEVANLRFSLAQQDRRDVIGPLTVPIDQLSSTLNQGQQIPVQFSGVPLGTHLMLRIEALDGAGNRLQDFEDRIHIHQDDHPIEALLTPVEAFRSGAFYTMPMLALEPEVAKMLADSPELAPAGVQLVGNTLGYGPTPCAGWTLEVDGKSYPIGEEGRGRFLASALSGETGILRHPADPELSAEVLLSALGPGKITDETFVLAFEFQGGCGMDARTLRDEFCGRPIGLGITGLEVAAQALKQVVPASENTTNKCLQRVPGPTQFQVLERGHYPEPKSFFSNGTVQLFATQINCEQTNGGLTGPVSRGEVVFSADVDGSAKNYLFSTCHRYVVFGCCPNENFLADLANVPGAAIAPLIEAGSQALSYFFGTQERNILEPALIPRDTKTCPDNHLGRQCQELLVGDVSLDFKAGSGGVKFPLDPEQLILVSPGETVEFVLHNNGCFGSTKVKATKQEINGSLVRSYREFAITPPVQGSGFNLPKLQKCTDPLLEGAPTAGARQNFSVPSPPQNATPSAPDKFGQGGRETEIIHGEIDGNIAVNPGGTNFARYRYFPDVALKYQVPADVGAGLEDRFVFTVDDCAVAVTFRTTGTAVPTPDPSTAPPTESPTPDPSATPTPEDIISVGVSAITGSHIVFTTSCPQSLDQVPISNPSSSATLTVTIEAESPILADSVTSFQLEPGQSLDPPLEVFFDCSTTTSFTENLTITGTSTEGTETIVIPVSVNIQN